MAENVAGWIGLTGQGPNLEVKDEFPRMAQPFIETIKAKKAAEEKRKQKEIDDANKLYDDIFKAMVTINKPMLPGRQEEMLKRSTQILTGIAAKRSKDPNFNPVSDSVMSELAKLKSDVLQYGSEYDAYVKDATHARNNPLTTEVEPWFGDIMKMDNEQLNAQFGGSLYQPGSGAKAQYRKLATQDEIKKLAPVYDSNYFDPATRTYTVKAVTGWSDKIPKSKEQAEAKIDEYLAGQSYPAKGFIQLGQDKALKDNPQLVNDVSLLAKESLKNAKEHLLQMTEENRFKTGSYPAVGFGRTGGGGGNYETNDGTYSYLDNNTSAEYATLYVKQVREQRIAEFIEKDEKEHSRIMAKKDKTEEDKKWLKEYSAKGDPYEYWSGLVDMAAEQKEVRPNEAQAIKIERATPVAFKPKTDSRGNISVGNFKGTLKAVLIDPDTDEIIAAVANGKAGAEKQLNDRVFMIADNKAILGQILTSATSLNETYNNFTGRNIKNFNVSAGTQMKGGQTKGQAPAVSKGAVQTNKNAKNYKIKGKSYSLAELEDMGYTEEQVKSYKIN